MPTVIVGNTCPIRVKEDADPITPKAEDKVMVEIDNDRKDNHTITTFEVAPSTSILDAVRDIVTAFRGYHSTEPPAFVVSTDPLLQEILCREFGCPTTPPKTFRATKLLGMKE